MNPTIPIMSCVVTCIFYKNLFHLPLLFTTYEKNRLLTTDEKGQRKKLRRKTQKICERFRQQQQLKDIFIFQWHQQQNDRFTHVCCVPIDLVLCWYVSVHIAVGVGGGGSNSSCCCK